MFLLVWSFMFWTAAGTSSLSNFPSTTSAPAITPMGSIRDWHPPPCLAAQPAPRSSSARGEFPGVNVHLFGLLRRTICPLPFSGTVMLGLKFPLFRSLVNSNVLSSPFMARSFNTLSSCLWILASCRFILFDHSLATQASRHGIICLRFGCRDVEYTWMPRKRRNLLSGLKTEQNI